MEYTRFFALIKENALHGAYLLHGAEEYIKASAVTSLINTIPDAARELNAQTLTGPEASQVISACETLPFFADQRVVIVKDFATAELAKIKDYVPNVPQSTILLLYYRGEFTNGQSAVLKQLTKEDRVIRCDPLQEDEAVRWVLTQAQRMSLLIEPAIARHLVVLAGTDVSTLYNELQKLSSGVEPGMPVTAALLQAVVSPNIEYKMFNMLSSFLSGKKSDGLRTMRQIVKENPKDVSAMIGFFTNQFRQLYLAKQLLNAKCREQDAAKRMGGSPYAASKALQNAKRLTDEQIAIGLHAFCGAGVQFKTGAATDIQALELAVHAAFPNKRAV